MKKYLLIVVFLLGGLAHNVEAATVYIDCSCSTNGDGTGQTCGANGPKNAPVTTVSANTDYKYKTDVTCNLASTAITINQSAVTISSYGTGAKPIITGGSTAYPIVLNTTNGSTISDIAITNGSSGGLNVNGSAVNSVIDGVDITTSVIGFIVNSSGVNGLTLKNMNITCSGLASICTNVSTNGGGVTFRDSSVTLTAADKSSANLIGIRLNGTSTVVDNVTVTGGDLGIEIRTTDGHIVRNSLIQNSATSGIRMRDSSNNIIEDNEVKGVWNGRYYNDGAGAGNNGGTGAGVDLIDISDACGSNIVRRNYIHDVYQGILDQCDVEGGNQFYSNVLHDYLVNGISYQSDGAEGLIANNSIYHTPYDPVATVGHGIVIQNGSATTQARIINNTITCDATGTNVQCISLPLSASTGTTTVNNNNYYPMNGTPLGALGGVNYATFDLWKSALQGDADTLGDDSLSLNVNPYHVVPLPLNKQQFHLSPSSTLIGAGVRIGDYTDNLGRYFDYKPSIGAFELGSGDFSSTRPWAL